MDQAIGRAAIDTDTRVEHEVATRSQPHPSPQHHRDISDCGPGTPANLSRRRNAVRVVVLGQDPVSADVVFQAVAERAGVEAILADIAEGVRCDAFGFSGGAVPDLAILDLSPSEPNPLHVIRQCRKALPDTPLILLVDGDQEETALAALHLGIDEYLVKDALDTTELLLTVANALAAFCRKRGTSQAVRDVAEASRSRNGHTEPPGSLSSVPRQDRGCDESAHKGLRPLADRSPPGNADATSSPPRPVLAPNAARVEAAGQPSSDGAPPAAGGNECPVFDSESALDRVAGDIELLAELVELFEEDLPEQLSEAAQAAAAGDHDRLCRVAHRLKNSLGNLGAVRGEKLALGIEKAAREGTLVAGTELVEALRREVENFLPQLHEFLAQRSASPAPGSL